MKSANTDLKPGKKLEIPLRAVISEGEKGLSRRKFTVEEKEVLEKYVPFYDVEDVGSQLKAKL